MNTRYEFIKEAVLRDMESGRIKSGNKLPSIREMAQRYKVSPATVIRAYSALEKENMAYAVSKSGYYAMKPPARMEAVAARQAYDLASAVPPPELLPVEAFKRCLNAAIDTHKTSLFTYTGPRGCEGLIKVLVQSLQEEQIFCRESEMVLTAGTYQALMLLAKMAFPNGRSGVLVEQPTYSGMLNILRLEGIKTIGIERDETGFDFDRLEALFKNGDIKFFYTMPRFHNPSGFSLSREQKRRMIQLAEAYQVYLVEDDYLGDLETDKRNDSLYALCPTDQVIYIRSFSKTFLPNIRVAAVILPKLLTNPFISLKKDCDIGNTTVNQAALEVFVSTGLYTKHRDGIRKVYQEKMAAMQKAWIASRVDAYHLMVPETGFFSYLMLPEGYSSEKLVTELYAKGIVLAGTRGMYLPGFFRDRCLRLSLVKMAEEDMIPRLEGLFKLVADTLPYARAHPYGEEDIGRQ